MANPRPNLRMLTEFLNEPKIAAQIAEMKKATGASRDALTQDDFNDVEEIDHTSFVGIILTSLNGQNDVRNQSVRVEYLSPSQVLILPAGLGMNVTAGGGTLTPNDERITTRYLKCLTMTYNDILGVVQGDGTVAQKKAQVDGRALPAARFQMPNYDDDNWYVDNNNRVYEYFEADHIIGIFSRMMGFNFDIRDFGFLTAGIADRRVADNAWASEIKEPITRLKTKLRPYTLYCIAALNYEACGKWDLGAWVRAFGVGAGLLPSEVTQLNKEWRYSKANMSEDVMTAVTAAHNKLRDDLRTLCLNMIAMFGLMHLAKNHTYRSGDHNMERIGVSYLNTLRTMVSQEVIEDMKSHMEIAIRTAAHPFGLGGTYFLAKALKAADAISTPLALRVSVTPPPVQRLMIVKAATKEWQNVPVALVINQVYERNLAIIAEAIAQIEENPPAYSELYRYYGLANKLDVDARAVEAADAMMPLIGGYAAAMHIHEGDRKDGLALALSLEQVQRDHKSLYVTYTSLWRNYIGKIDLAGLEMFLMGTIKQDDADTRSRTVAG